MISCVCLTIPGRTAFLKRAIDCFKRQTYQDRELVIVADTIDELTAVEDCLDGPIQLEISGKQSVGAKRNLGCLAARGDTIALWDDDDYSAPKRLEEQYADFVKSGKAVTAMYRIYLTNADCSMWWLSYHGWIDTSCMFKKSWWQDHQFPDKMIGEDADFMHEANRFGQFHLHPGDEHWMFATNHPGNTCERSEQYHATSPTVLKNFTWVDK